VLDEAVPSGMLQDLSGEPHVGTKRADTQLGHLVGELLQKLPLLNSEWVIYGHIDRPGRANL
jgi:hypothetical protein